MIGQTLGHFRITARLGSGGMGVVYRAFDEELQRTIAIKLVGRDTGTPAADRLRLVEEARAASGLNHPHICTVYQTGEIDGQPFIAMDWYVEGHIALRADTRRRPATLQRRALWRPDCRRARARTQPRRRPSRPQDAERRRDAGRTSQGPRLRPRAADSVGHRDDGDAFE